jgi:uncharacterized protein (UPF0212 family)
MTGKWTCPHCEENAKALIVAAQSVVTSFENGWRIDGVIKQMKEHLPKTKEINK